MTRTTESRFKSRSIEKIRRKHPYNNIIMVGGARGAGAWQGQCGRWPATDVESGGGGQRGSGSGGSNVCVRGSPPGNR